MLIQLTLGESSEEVPLTTTREIPRPAGDPTSQPIINTPYDPPQWYWTLDGRDRASSPPVKGRRRASGVLPVPQPRRPLPLPNDPSTSRPELTMVNRIRDLVEDWQDRRWPGITETTRHLLRHWHQEEREFRLYFAQLEAIRTLIWLHEVAPSDQSGREVLDEIAGYNESFNRGIPRVAVKMATGTGKTAVMAMAILWQASNYARNPADSRFTNRFAAITPGITVRERLEDGLVPDPINGDDTYSAMDLLPRESWRPYVNMARIDILNFHQLERKQVTMGMSTKGRQLAGYRPRIETDSQMVNRAFDTNADGPGSIMVFNDEGHHCHNTESEASANDTDRKSADIWFKGMETLSELGRLHSAVDLSATPSFIASRRERIFPWTVSDYPLTDAIEAGIVKVPRVPVSDNISDDDLPLYRDIYNRTDDTKTISLTGDSANRDLKSAIRALYRSYETVSQQWRDRGEPVPPVFIVVANSIKNATRLFDWLSGYSDGSGEWAPGQLSLFDNIDPQNRLPLKIPRTILMHSRLEDPEADTSKAMTEYLKRQVELFREAYPDAVTNNRRFSDCKPNEIMRHVLNTVGKPGEPGANVRCVVSVNMLTEGWDTRTVTHLVGFRKFGTQLLCEQVAGRSLRRTNHDIEKSTGMFTPEYAEILGIPYHYVQDGGDQDDDDITPLPTYYVHAVPERAGYRVHWPNVASYDERNGSDLVVTVSPPNLDEMPVLNIPRHRPIRATVEGIVAPGVTVEDSPLRRQRFCYEATSAAVVLLDQKQKLGENAPTTRKRPLFGSMLGIVRRALDAGRLVGPREDLWPNLASGWPERVAKHIIEYCTASTDTMERRIIARGEPPYFSDSGQMRPYYTSRIYYRATEKSEVNIAVCDSGWEVQVAGVLDNHPLVLRWVRNERLGWHIPWFDGLEWRRYFPDFVAHLDIGQESPLNLVLEVKGREEPEDLVKKRYAEEFWLPGVNSSSRYGEDGVWEYMYIVDPDLAHQQIDQLIRRTEELEQ